MPSRPRPRFARIRSLIRRLTEQNPLPDGALPVAVGLVVNGAATYAFFGIASRTLAAATYSAISAFWAVLYAIGNGIMQPLEQEVARACSARRAKGVGSGPVIRRAMVIGGSFWVLVAAVIAVAATQGAFQRLFHDNQVLTFSLIIGLGGFCVGHLTRGTLSSHHRFGRYGAFFSVDGLIRVVLAAALGALGVLAAGPWGLVMATTPFLAAFAALWRQKGLLEPGPDAPWGELTQNLGWLLLGTSSISLVVQGGTIAVGRLATSTQQAAAGQFLNGLQTARIPLFLFQAILASLLPKLSRQAETGRLAEFSAGLRRLVLAILGVGVLAVVGAALLGPTLIRIVFGTQSALTRWDLALLALAYIIIMATICIDQGLVALYAHSRMAIGWFCALLVFIGVTLAGTELFRRVEIGLLSASVFAFVWMLTCLMLGLRRHRGIHAIELADAMADLPTEM
jgi:O-antigen/teichoic acid export membrane protein